MSPRAVTSNVTALRVCRSCGCTDHNACVTDDGPCCWVLLDVETRSGICSACADEAGWNPAWMAGVGYAQEPRQSVLLP